ncbi:MAG: DUF7544 domain-containing protein [Halococcoides sp.]
MVWYAVERVEDAIELTSDRLWPFEWSTWWRFALLMFFVGGGGGAVTNVFTQGMPDPGVSEPSGSLGVSPAVVLAVVAVVALLAITLALLLAVIGAVMEFVFVDAIRSESVSIRAWFREHLWSGAQLFVFRFGVGLLAAGVGLVFALGLAVVIGVTALGVAQSELIALGVVLGLIYLVIAVPLYILVAIASGIVQGFTTNFAVPIMMTDDANIVAAWISLGRLVRAEWKQLLLYVVVMVLIGIGIAILEFILLAAGAIVVAIPFGLLATPFAALAVWGNGSLGAVAIGVLVVLGVLFVIGVVIVGLFVTVPLVTFKRTFALLVLGDLDEHFDVFEGDRPAIERESPAE